MPAPHENPLRVFYSWQSDLPDAVNLQLIRNALSQAGNVINADHDLNLHVVIDEATREVPGSPNIADSIFAKIRESDVFVCDLTKVAETSNYAGEVRKYCNPNAALELGYAVRVLGWNRIIIVFNEGYGVVPDDLPFDARGHRTSKYRCKAELDEKVKPTAACQSQISNSTGNLREVFVDALKLIAKDDPKRPQELEAKTPEVIQRERDVEQLKDIFCWINVNMLDHFINGLQNGRLRIIGWEFCDFLGALINGAGFHFYDAMLQRLVIDFYQAWRPCGPHVNAMEVNKQLTELRFVLPMDMFTSREQERQYSETKSYAIPLRQALDALLRYVRVNYLEIDLSASGAEAVEKFLAPIE